MSFPLVIDLATAGSVASMVLGLTAPLVAACALVLWAGVAAAVGYLCSSCRRPRHGLRA